MTTAGIGDESPVLLMDRIRRNVDCPVLFSLDSPCEPGRAEGQVAGFEKAALVSRITELESEVSVCRRAQQLLSELHPSVDVVSRLYLLEDMYRGDLISRDSQISKLKSELDALRQANARQAAEADHATERILEVAQRPYSAAAARCAHLQGLLEREVQLRSTVESELEELKRRHSDSSNFDLATELARMRIRTHRMKSVSESHEMGAADFEHEPSGRESTSCRENTGPSIDELSRKLAECRAEKRIAEIRCATELESLRMDMEHLRASSVKKIGYLEERVRQNSKQFQRSEGFSGLVRQLQKQKQTLESSVTDLTVENQELAAKFQEAMSTLEGLNQSLLDREERLSAMKADHETELVAVQSELTRVSDKLSSIVAAPVTRSFDKPLRCLKVETIVGRNRDTVSEPNSDIYEAHLEEVMLQAEFLCSRNQFQEAASLLEGTIGDCQSLDLSIDDQLKSLVSDLFGQLGVCRQSMGYLKEAAEAYNQGLEIDDKSHGCHANLSLILCSFGDLHGAILHAEAACALVPHDQAYIDNRASICAKLSEAQGSVGSSNEEALSVSLIHDRSLKDDRSTGAKRSTEASTSVGHEGNEGASSGDSPIQPSALFRQPSQYNIKVRSA